MTKKMIFFPWTKFQPWDLCLNYDCGNCPLWEFDCKYRSYK